jgi:hypothetical protein
LYRFRPTLSAAVPDGWFVKESLTLLSPDGQANIIASSEPLDPSITSDRYAEVQGRLLVEEFPGYREAVFRRLKVFGGREGFFRQFTWEPPDGTLVTQLQIYYAEGGRGYTATATSTVVGFLEYEAHLLSAVEGLVIASDAVSPQSPPKGQAQSA